MTDYPEKKLTIFKATIDLVAESGFHASPASVIAEKSGVGVGTVYRYFKSKDEIFDSLFEYVEEELNAAVTAGFNLRKPIREQFALLCSNMIHYSLNNVNASVYFDRYIDSPYGTNLRMFKRPRNGDTAPERTLLDPFYKLFNKGKKQKLIQDMSNSILFTLVYGALSHFIKDVSRGLVDYNEAVEKKVINACWNLVKRDSD